MGLFSPKQTVAAPVEESGILASVTDITPQNEPIQPFSAHRAYTASAARINLGKKTDVAKMADRPYVEWQTEAWEYYDAIGEIKYAFTLLGAVLSRIRIYGALNLDPDAVPSSTTMLRRRRANQNDKEKLQDETDALALPADVTDEVMDYIEQLVRDLGNGPGGFPGLMRSFAVNIGVPGEVYLTQIDGRWSFKSTEEVRLRESDRKLVLRTMRATGNRVTGDPRERELPKGTYIARIWRSHPRFSDEPDSSMIGIREMCDELLMLQRMIRATARSKMNAGMVFIPDGITSAASSVTGSIEEEELEADAFEQEFIESIVAPIMDESSTATVAPMVARGPAELGAQIKYTQFSRDSDKALVERAHTSLERALQGLDIPKDVVKGMANVRYSNAINIDESLYKAHVEPTALLLVDALTTVYLIPAIKQKFPDLTDDTIQKIVIWYDPTEVVTKPDPATAANTLHDKFAISNDALRRAHGFSDSDAPDENEIAGRLAIEKGVMGPDLVAALVKHLLPSIFAAQQAENIAAQPVPMPNSARDLLGLPPAAAADQSQSTPPTPNPSEPSGNPSAGFAPV